MYLIDELPMRYDLSLFQFVLILMEIMGLVQENMENARARWLKMNAIISSVNKRNWNMQLYASKALQEQGYYGTHVPNSVH